MTTYLVLTLIGKDKPGLVEQLAQTISDHSGNWQESSMSQLAGKFAGILRVSVADKDADALVSALQNLSTGLKLVIEKADVEDVVDNQQTVELNLVGNDRPGIIREISRVLANLGINVEELTTECVPAPMTGDILFKANACLKVPQETPLESLQLALEKLADDLIVEIQLS
mgnify:CR=1 FL=1